jgi:hypothetical protein
MILFVALIALMAFSALARPAATAQEKQLEFKRPKLTITDVTRLSASTGCADNTNCALVKWELDSKAANPTTLSFEVSGKFFTEQGASCNTNVATAGHATRIVKLQAFNGGACGGLITRADVTVKLFTQEPRGQRRLLSTASKSQTF